MNNENNNNEDINNENNNKISNNDINNTNKNINTNINKNINNNTNKNINTNINKDINNDNSNKKNKKIVKNNTMQLLEIKSKYAFLFEDETKKIKNKNNKNKSPQKKIKKNNSTVNFNKQKVYTKFKNTELNYQNKKTKKYLYKNKETQEKEILFGAIEYLQSDYKNKNNKNNVPLSLAKTSYNEKKYSYKVPYDFKKKVKNIGEDSTISLNSTSSEPQIIIINNNYINEKQRILNFSRKNTKNNYYLKSIPKLQKCSSQKNYKLSENNKILNTSNSCKILKPIIQSTRNENKQKINFYENKNRHFKELPKNKGEDIENSKFKSVLDKYFKCLKKKDNIITNNVIIENCKERGNITKEDNIKDNIKQIKKNNNDEKNNLKECINNSQKNDNLNKNQSEVKVKNPNLKNNSSFFQEEESINSSDFLDNDSGFREKFFNKPNADSALIVNINQLNNKNNFLDDNNNEKIKQQINADKLNYKISKSTKNDKLSFLNEDRAKNIQLILQKIKIKPEYIINALINFNDRILSNNICDMILNILPDKTEIQKINNTNKNKSEYTECEKFMKSLIEISYYKERLLSIKFKNSFQENYRNINFEILKILNVIHNFKKDKNIKKWIEIILGFKDYIKGNFENGFKLEMLEKILETKLNDNKKNLLYFIIEWIIDNKQTQLIGININYVKNSLSINELEKNYIELKNIFNNNVSKLKKNVFSEKCILFLENFYDKTEKSLNEIEIKICNVKKEYKEMIKIFGENNIEWNKFFGEFITFFDNVKSTAEIIKKK